MWYAPWWKDGQVDWHKGPSTFTLEDYMSKAMETADLGKDPEAARLASQLKVLTEAKKPVSAPKPAYMVLKEATAECSRKQD
eukprot:5404973-Pyramimonas_sp.AAC.1